MEKQDTPPTPEDSGQPTKTPGNQLTTALIVIIVVLLFVMLLLSLNGNLFTGKTKDNLTDLQSQNTQLRAEINAQRASKGLPPLPENATTARTMADRLQRDANALAAMTTQWQQELDQKDGQLRKMESQIAGHSQNTQQLYQQIATLQSQLSQNQTAAAQATQLQNDLKIANNQIATLNKQLASYQSRPTNEQVALLRKQLSDSIQANDTLKLKADKLEAEAKNSVSKAKYDAIAQELAQLKPQLRSQRYEIQRLRAQLDRAQLFIESAEKLPAEAARLFTRLKTLENVNEQQLKAAYQNIQTNLGAKIIHRQAFATGSAQIDFDKESLIRGAVNDSNNPNTFFLVVGYASKSGGNQQNRELSSKRATTVASVVNALRASNQKVRAVYLGETNRFSASDEKQNQICEVWEIKP